jgi:mono/diheme cytochrome c family protein
MTAQAAREEPDVSKTMTQLSSKTRVEMQGIAALFLSPGPLSSERTVVREACLKRNVSKEGRGSMKRKYALAIALSTLVATAAVAADAPPAIYTQKCELCHSIAGQGGKKKDVGGALDGVGAKHDEAWLRAYIPDPKSKLPDSKMPKFNLAPADMDAVTKFLLSLK